MPVSAALLKELETLDPKTRRVLILVLEEIERHMEESVTRREFREFARQTQENFEKVWAAIRELTEAQRRNEAAIRELTEAQKRNEEAIRELRESQRELAEEMRQGFQEVWGAIRELTEAQKRTEEEMRRGFTEMWEAIHSLTRALHITRRQVGGLSQSVAYALENEAYRQLPKLLKERYGIDVLERMIRVEVEGKELNLLARARWDGKEVMLVGEAVLRLDDRSKVRNVLEKARLVERVYGKEAVPVVVTHFARPRLLEYAQKRGLIVVQSFEWG